LDFADVLSCYAIPFCVAQCFPEHAMRMANGTRSQPAGAKRRVPRLKVKACELLQGRDAEMWDDLVLDQLPVALRGPGRDSASRLPLVYASANEVGHGSFARLYVGARAYRGD
jgi:hypothetical protein